MSERLTLRLRVRVTRRRVICALALLCLLGAPRTLVSLETVTLSTYYPAPTGVYTRVVTDDQTWLGSSGGVVTIGSTRSPAAGVLLRVDNGNAVFRDKISINQAAAPTATVDVKGLGAGADVLVSAGGTSVLLGQAGSTGKVVAAGALGLNINGSDIVYLTGAGRMGINTTSPNAALDVVGSFNAGGSCAARAYGIGTTSCGSGYATMFPGVMAPYSAAGSGLWRPPTPYASGGFMYCCSCPSGGCPVWP